MIIILILYLIYLLVFIVFNVYVILRIWSLRTKGDQAGVMVLIYTCIISTIILISLVWISGLDWSNNLNLGLR